LKHEIEDNPSEPIAATDRNQTRNNLANVALMDSNPNEREEVLMQVTSIDSTISWFWLPKI